jgi:hypothetical protein
MQVQGGDTTGGGPAGEAAQGAGPDIYISGAGHSPQGNDIAHKPMIRSLVFMLKYLSVNAELGLSNCSGMLAIMTSCSVPAACAACAQGLDLHSSCRLIGQRLQKMAPTCTLYSGCAVSAFSRQKHTGSWR